jgi:acetoin utilization deacetylase AcuC-like enzyme
MTKEDVFKTAFMCPGFVGLFKWVVMTFWFRNAGATYQRAMNLIFHGLLGILLEVYIEDLVVMSAGFDGHMADLRIVFERMRKYNLKMNLLKCDFGMLAGRFLGFIVREGGIEIDPKKIESIEKLAEPTCKQDVKKNIGEGELLEVLHRELSRES